MFVSTPLTIYFKISTDLSPQNENKAKNMYVVPYLVYLKVLYYMLCTGYEISKAVNVVSMYICNP